MQLSASIALSNTLLSLVVALATSPDIGINVPVGVKKPACLSLRSLLILMIVCVTGSIVLWLHIMNWFDCLLGWKFLSMDESAAFEYYIRTAHNPNFVPVSRKTTRDMVKYFTGKKVKLVENLSSSVVNCVCLTSNIWYGNAKEDYLSVVAHYINTDWQLGEKGVWSCAY
jgi:hypothetical protein